MKSLGFGLPRSIQRGIHPTLLSSRFAHFCDSNATSSKNAKARFSGPELPDTPWDCHRTADQLGWWWFWGSIDRHISYMAHTHGVFGNVHGDHSHGDSFVVSIWARRPRRPRGSGQIHAGEGAVSGALRCRSGGFGARVFFFGCLKAV